MSNSRAPHRVWGVSALVQAIADSLAARFATVVVRGELSGFTRASSGHGYFTLKDEAGGAGLRCAMFRRALSGVDFAPADGMVVEATGTLSVYEARGELQLVVERLTRAGEGALYEQFLRLKAKLEAQGLFDAQRKRPLPMFPARVGVLTSLAAAALQDVLTALRRRAPHVEVVVVHCGVQGPEAPAQIVDGLHALQAWHRQSQALDAVIVCRGGGSLEDLWAFNDERVVRAIAACQVPVVCGVGHETDFTLSDFAADVRASTPTAAAELVARDRADFLADLNQIEQTLRMRVRRRLDGHAQSLDQLARRLRGPAQMVAGHRQVLERAAHRLGEAGRRRLDRERLGLPPLAARLLRGLNVRVAGQRQHLDALASRLHSVNPDRVLERGYAWLTSLEGQAITSIQDVAPGQALSAVLADGRVDATVDAVHDRPAG